eukprot:4721562-Prorocentrum_lima.AAC.1
MPCKALGQADQERPIFAACCRPLTIRQAGNRQEAARSRERTYLTKLRTLLRRSRGRGWHRGPLGQPSGWCDDSRAT